VALPLPGKYLHQMPSQAVFPVLDRLEPATGALALGKAFNQTLAQSVRQKMSTDCDMEAGELSAAFPGGVVSSHVSAVLRDDGDPTNDRLSSAGRVLP
jgi:hypothetical protein